MVVRSRLSETRAHLSNRSSCFRQSNDRSRPATWATTTAMAESLSPVAPSSGKSRIFFIRAGCWWIRIGTGRHAPCTVCSGHRRDKQENGCRPRRCGTASGHLDRRGPTWKPGLPGAGCRQRLPANRRPHEELLTPPERAGNAIVTKPSERQEHSSMPMTRSFNSPIWAISVRYGGNGTFRHFLAPAIA